ncbi:putative SAM-dependent methyltransferase [Mycoplasmopsis californica]|uniref:Ribosomal RNA small subunit methyltransferase I n=1 Tax=Mycoplasmopsis equigenitalium TaxID=114883 RepID=A0ABY5J2F2_9BACT|nr:16S rRNA (cytidine(1402)-2'-O)-methyltransferase [Mycoplasmopsis equigenitalium]UUD36948.1 16S rRNA (cytidine(1402)-2'-O)-methyltransferase [Mycoplasmopsis equigenitalium]VEU69757.1 putative SAM-dependent methyltransferase [Mycoplasmopsis californica]
MSKLYLVATPIGNLKDITLRALEVLGSVDYIACEDTRTSAKLLNHYNIKKPLLSHHTHNERNSTKGILKLLEEGKNVALISDAGMPIISDPGFNLLQEAKEHNFEFEIIPGASASVLAFAYSNLGNSFTFLGFLESKTTRIKNQLSSLPKGTYVAFVSPHKLMTTMSIFQENFNKNVEIYLVKELTKVNEKHFTGTPDEVIEQLNKSSLKGEFTIVFKIK